MSNIIRRLVPIAAGTVLLVAAAAPMDLHLALKQSIPARDATVTASPARVELQFTQAPQMAATSIMLHTEAGGQVPVGQTVQKEGDNTAVIAPVSRPLAPGKYQVMWRAMAQDGHIINGTFDFTFRPSAAD